MKKRAAIFVTAAALVLSLAACGDQGSGTNDNAGAGGNTTGTHDNGSPGGSSGQSGSTNDNGTTNNGGVTNNSGIGGGATGGTTGNSGTTGGTTRERGTLGSGIRDAADDVGRAVDDLVDDVTGQRRADTMTSFEKMLDNARVHDVDGVLTDGENARW